MRHSIASLALITRHTADGIRYLLQWNPRWNRLNFVGGQREAGETFRECMLREAGEELRLPADELQVADRATAHLEYTAFSEAAQMATEYEIELFDLHITDEARLTAVADRPENAWVSEDDIRCGVADDGRSISPTVSLLLRKTGRLAAPRDPDVFTVGVTGHRDLGPSQRRRLRKRLSVALQDVELLAAGRPLVMLSPLALGADQIAAEAALDHGYRLHAPLPLAVELYEQDFRGPELPGFRHLLAQAREWYALPVPGGLCYDQLRHDQLHDHGPARSRMYAAVGRHVVQRCDLLIAAWDGRRTRKTGGTDETLAYALQSAGGRDDLLRIQVMDMRRAARHDG